MDEICNIKSISCGTEAAKYFALQEGYRNLNHGKFSPNGWNFVLDACESIEQKGQRDSRCDDSIANTSKARLGHIQRPSDQSCATIKIERKQHQTPSSVTNILNVSMNLERR